MPDFFRLQFRDQWLLLRTAVLMSLIRLGLMVLGFQRLWQLLEKGQPSVLRPDETHLKQVIWAVEIISRWTPGGVTCLPRALTTQFMLSRYGQPSTLRIGVVLDEGHKLNAHAWVEVQGKIVMGQLSDLSRYTPLPLHQVERL
jgi:hypothetical protein